MDSLKGWMIRLKALIRQDRRILFLILISSGLVLGVILGFFTGMEEPIEELQKEPFVNEGRIFNLLLRDLDLSQFQLELPDQFQEVVSPYKAFTAPMEELELTNVYLEEMIPPYEGEVITEFGWYRHPRFQDWRYNPGLQYKGDEGPVLASMGGRVLGVHDDGSILLEHGGGLKTYYGHLGEVLVEYGQMVERGETIAYLEKSPDYLEKVFSFYVMEGEDPLDPYLYLRTK